MRVYRRIIRSKKNDRKGYTQSLFLSGKEKIAQKVGEESVEVVIEAMKGEAGRLAHEVVDLLYHIAVLVEACDAPWSQIEKVIRVRMQKGKKDENYSRK